MTRLPTRVALVLMLALVIAGCRIILWSWPAGEPVPNVVGSGRGRGWCRRRSRYAS